MQRGLIQAAVLAVLLGAVTLVLVRAVPFLALAENWVLDLRTVRLAPQVPPNDGIVVVTITESTLETLAYRSPFDRRFLARLLRTLDDKGARLIGLDLLLDQPTEPAKDRELFEAMRAIKAPLIVAAAGGGEGLSETQQSFQKSYLDGIKQAWPNLTKDPVDGVVRWIYPGRDVDGAPRSGLVGAIARELHIAPPKGFTPIRYLRPRGDGGTSYLPIRAYPSVVAPSLPKSWIEGKVVLIGADLPMSDRHRTPFVALYGINKGTLPGVIIHAHALAQVMAGDHPPVLSIWAEIALIIGLAAAGIGVAAGRMPLALRIALYVLVPAVLWAAALAVSAGRGAPLPVVAPTLAFGLAVVLSITYFRRRELEQKRFLRRAFSQYLAPTVVDQLIEHPEQLTLTGERKVLSFLFSDLRSFTAFCEHTAPDKFLPVMNSYLDGLSRVLTEHGGTIDNISGDSINGIFGAPLEQPDHAELAVACALAMDRFGRRFSARQQKHGIDFQYTRVGVHTGEATVGNFGGERRFHYTAHGDAVNVASRLEGANKYLGSHVCVSAATVAACAGRRFRPLAGILVQGREQPLAVFEPLPEDGPPADYIQAYLEAYRLLDSGADASEAFARLAERAPGDGVVTMHLNRLRGGERGTLITLAGK